MAHVTITNISKTVTTAGTRERLVATSTLVPTATICAKRSNTGLVYIGGSDVADSNTAPLFAGDCMQLAHPNMLYDLTDMWIDVSVNGEGVTVEYPEVP